MTTSESGTVRRRSRRMQRAGLAFGLSCLALISTAGPAAADPPTNSSFETPDTANATFTTFTAPSTGITGWTVVSGSVDIQDAGGTNPPAAEGDQYLDLAGSAPGVIQQSFPTVAGVGYVIAWEFGASNFSCGGQVKSGTFSVQGAAVETMSAPVVAGTVAWQTRSTTFTGTGGPVTLQFADTSLPVSNCGLYIDNVQIAVDAAVPVVDPKVAGIALSVAVGGGLYLLHRKRSQRELGRAVAV